MNQRPSKNSILFVATLGVYLGLVFVGASPVLGHIANTRSFDLRDEIEFADELDKKPDTDAVALTISLQNYLEDVETLVSSLENHRSAGTFDLQNDRFDVAQTTLLPCVADNRVGSYSAVRFTTSSERLRPTLERLTKLLTDGYSLADCISNERFAPTDVASSQFRVLLDDGELSIEVAVKKSSQAMAVSAVSGLHAARANVRVRAGSRIPQLIGSTRFFAANDQVFVVTRLPRAGLSALLSA